MSFLKNKKNLILVLISTAILAFSSLFGILFFCIKDDKDVEIKRDLRYYSEYFTLHEMKKVDDDKSKVEMRVQAVDADGAMTNLLVLMILSLVEGESQFTISSTTALNYYMSLTHLELTDYTNPRHGVYLYAGGVLTVKSYTYYDSYKPVNYRLRVELGAGTYTAPFVDPETLILYNVTFTIGKDFSNYTYVCELELLEDLTINVDSTYKNFSQFAGIFDGNGHTITYNVSDTWAAMTDAFCTYSSGTIQNLKLSGSKICLKSDADGGKGVMGAMVEENVGTVQSCIVEDCQFLSDRFRTNCFVAPIVGLNSGSGKVQNCMVLGYYKIGGRNNNGLLNPDGLNAYYFVADGNGATNSIYCATVDTSIAVNKDYVYPPGHTEQEEPVYREMTDNYTSCSSAYNSISSASTTAGNIYTVNYPWYKYRSTSYGFGGSSTYCVYLRVFMTWSYFTFKADPTDAGTVSQSNLTVPSDYTSVSKSGSTLTIYGTAITASAKQNSFYTFDKWTNSGKSYTAVFKIDGIEISFAAAANAIVSSSSTARIGTVYYLKSQVQDINIKYDKYKKEGFRSVTFKFTTVDGESLHITFSTRNNNDVETHYFISGHSLNTTAETFEVNSTTKSQLKDITVYTALKSYQITW